jgi:hypothetical protein
MFFTTTVMVVLLIVALSTATYAWFSTNSTVEVTDTKVTAARSESAAIGIGWTILEAQTKTEIAFTSKYVGDYAILLEPMMPKFLPSDGTEGVNTSAYYISSPVKLATDSSIKTIDYAFKPQVNTITDWSNVVKAVKVIDLKAGEDTTWNYITDNSISISAIDASIEISSESAERIPYNKIYYVRKPLSEGINLLDPSIEILASEMEKITHTDGKEYDFLTITEEEGVAGTISFTDAISTYDNIGLTNIQTDDGKRIYNIIENGLKPKYYVAHYADKFEGGLVGGEINEVAIEEEGTYLLTIKGKHELDHVMGYYLENSYSSVVQEPGNMETVGVKDQYIYKILNDENNISATTLKYFTGEEGNSNFNTGYIDKANNFDGTTVFDKNPALMTPLNDVPSVAPGVFVVRNNNAPGGKKANLTIKAEIDRPELRIAVFVSDSKVDLDYKYTLSQESNAKTGYGTIVPGANKKPYIDKLQYETVNNAVDIELFLGLEPQKNLYVAIVVWFDGDRIDASNGGEPTAFRLYITGDPQ